MDNNEIDLEYFKGNPVVYSNLPKPAYNPLNRPKIKYTKFFVSIICFVILTLGSYFLTANFVPDDFLESISLSKKQFSIIITFVVSAVFILAIGKRALIWMVHVYQHYASERIRRKCVFEPSCSEYMIMSLNKYGLFKGLFKGVHRLFRCHPPNGGKDLP